MVQIKEMTKNMAAEAKNSFAGCRYVIEVKHPGHGDNPGLKHAGRNTAGGLVKPGQERTRSYYQQKIKAILNLDIRTEFQQGQRILGRFPWKIMPGQYPKNPLKIR